MTQTALKKIFDKTKGHCHFCGDRLKFANRGWRKSDTRWDGHWEADHVIQLHKGGARSAENCLAACTRCNRLRWQRKGRSLRNLLVLGLVAKSQVKQRTKLGRKLEERRKAWLDDNRRRRLGPVVTRKI